MTTMVSLRKGHDVNYFTSSDGHGGTCAGAMAYYTRAGEPAGQWAGRAAAKLGLAGQVDAHVIRLLYQQGIGPGGEVLAKRRAPADEQAAEDAAVRQFRKDHPFASGTEIGEFRARERAKAGPKSTPYFDFTVSAVKSVSLLHASYRVAALLAREDGADGDAAVLDGRADAIEAALMRAAARAVEWLEAHATFTRTGHHGKTTGEWRDGGGLVASMFLHHLSRDGDPQLHVHVPVWNRVQRADRADDKWRTLYSRALYAQRLGLAPVTDRFMEAELRELGYVMVPRKDGNGCEVGGVDPAVMAQFSSRRVAITGELAELAEQWAVVHGKPPSRRTLWLLAQQATQNTRRAKRQAQRTVNGQVQAAVPDAAARLHAYEQAATDAEVRALSAVHRDVEEFARALAPAGAPGPSGLVPLPGQVLDDAARRRVARIAVAEVQKRHSAWTMAQLRFEVHRALGAGAVEADVDAVAALAVSGRAGTGVVQVGSAPDVADVAELGVRASDGGSVYRPPLAERWCTVDHLDLEEWIVAQARRPARQMVGERQARDAVAATDLTGPQAEAVVAMLTAGAVTVPLDAAAGSGKSHTMAVFAELWTAFTGARVIGLTTSTNAAKVLATEGLAESYNIAEFLGKVKGSDELRRPVPVNEHDVLVVDEATQVGTADMAALVQAAKSAGARLYPVGDTQQLGAVDAGGIFQLMAEDIPGPALAEVLRFRNAWEADASARLRHRDAGVIAVYDRRGRVHGADAGAALAGAARAYLADLLRGRDVLLLAGSNAEAGEMAQLVQAELVKAGRVDRPVVPLADGNQAGTGDLIRARLNTDIDAGGQRLTNRDTLRVDTYMRGAGGEITGVWAERRTAEGWSARFPVPAAYLAESAELDYAGNVHVAQGRTVDVGHLLVSPSLGRRGMYVGLTRGREENHAWAVTGNTAPPGKAAFEQATAESVLAAALEREDPELSATATMRAGLDWAEGAGHVLHLWSVSVRESLYPQIDREVTARLDGAQARRYLAEHARKAFHARLREAQLAGHDIGELIGRVMDAPLAGARSVASVLHSRLEGLGLDTRHDVSWGARTPDGAPGLARDLAGGLDARMGELGERAAARPEPWVLRRLGQLDPAASPALRGEWVRRAGVAAAYREAAGITDPGQVLSAEPHAGNPELETFRRMAMHAMEIRDEAELLAGMSRGELESLVAGGERAVAAAPDDVTGRLRSSAHAKADAWAQAAAAQVAGDEPGAAQARDLAATLEAEHGRLEAGAVAYEQWSGATAADRDRAGKAKAELARRGYQPAPAVAEGAEAETVAGWWARFGVQADAADAAIGAQRQAAARAGTPWPPVPGPRGPGREGPSAAELIAGLRRDGYLGGPVPSEAAAGNDTQAGPGTPPLPVPGPPDAEAGAASPGLPGPASPRSVQPSPPPPSPDAVPGSPAASPTVPDAVGPARGPDPVSPAGGAAGTRPDSEPATDQPVSLDLPGEDPTPVGAEGREGRLDELQARASAAAGRLAAERAGREADSEHAARMAREADREPEAEPEPEPGGWQAGIPDEEMEPGG